MKKSYGILLAAAMVAALGMPAAAAETEALAETEAAATGTYLAEYPEAGLTVAIPASLSNTKGYFTPEACGALDDDHHVYGVVFIYFPMSEEEVSEAFYGEDATEEQYYEVLNSQIAPSFFLASELDPEETAKAYEEWDQGFYPMDFDHASVLGSSDGYTYYLVDLKKEKLDEYTAALEKEYADEVASVQEQLHEVMKSATTYAPEDPLKDLVGDKIEFTLKDLDGNTVESKDLFAKNKVTMINCWGTWCGACMSEMDYLKELSEKVQEAGGGIVGFAWEKTTEDAAYEKTREFIDENGIPYPNVRMPLELVEQVSGFPTSIFVDQEGKVLGAPIVGANTPAYDSGFNRFLGLKDESTETETEAAAGSQDKSAAPAAIQTGYDVNVKDADGPVAGVMIQFCDDSTCNMGTTDENGVAHFDLPSGKEYEIHILVAPDGYQEDETVYHPDENNQATIELKKAE